MSKAISFLDSFVDKEYKHTGSDIAIIVQKEPKRIKELMECFFSDNIRICQRSAWTVGYLGKTCPELLDPYLEKMLYNLADAPHDAIIRNTFRTFQQIEFPEKIVGHAFDMSFKYFVCVKNAVAIRVFAMTVCSNISIKYPDLIPELILAIEANMEHGSAGFQSRGRKLLTKLRKIRL